MVDKTTRVEMQDWNMRTEKKWQIENNVEENKGLDYSPGIIIIHVRGMAKYIHSQYINELT